MSEQWISASEAREIVAPGWKHGSPATDSVRQRARHGVIKTRASLYVSSRSGQSTTVEDHPIPEEFWSAHPFEENWTSGDFSTRMNVDGCLTDCQALGVTFERSGVEALAPASVSAGHAPQAASGDIRVPAKASKNPGGNPGKYDWAKAVGTVVFQWADSGLWHPKSQSEVQTKLSEWFSQQGQAPDDRQLKQYARWLYGEFKSRDSSAE